MRAPIRLTERFRCGAPMQRLRPPVPLSSLSEFRRQSCLSTVATGVQLAYTTAGEAVGALVNRTGRDDVAVLK
jgi:hypothetical protein